LVFFKISNKIITRREIVLGFSPHLLLFVFVHTSSPDLAEKEGKRRAPEWQKREGLQRDSQKRGWRLIITRQYPPLTHFQLIRAQSSGDEEPQVGS